MAEQSLNIFERDPNEMNKYLEVTFKKFLNLTYKKVSFPKFLPYRAILG